MEIVPGVHLVPGIPWSRVYLVEGKRLALVDAGPPWSAGRVEKYVRRIGRRPEDVAYILVTHSHPDHISGARRLIERTGASLVAHPMDAESTPNGGSHLSFKGPLGCSRAWLPFLPPTPVGQAAEEGTLLPALDDLRIVHTPGHTPGSVCYLLEDRQVLFTGDTLFSDGRKLSRSVPWPGYNRSDYRHSLAALANMEFDVLCGGHGSPMIGGAADKLRELLTSDPEPPTWGQAFSRLPKRLLSAVGSRGSNS